MTDGGMYGAAAVVIVPVAVVAHHNTVLGVARVVRLPQVKICVLRDTGVGGPHEPPLHQQVFQADPGVGHWDRHSAHI